MQKLLVWGLDGGVQVGRKPHCSGVVSVPLSRGLAWLFFLGILKPCRLTHIPASREQSDAPRPSLIAFAHKSLILNTVLAQSGSSVDE